MAIPFSDQVELYSFGNYAQRQVEGGFFFRNPDTRSGVFARTVTDEMGTPDDTSDDLVERFRLVGDLTANGTGACPVILLERNDAGVVTADPNGNADMLTQQVMSDPNCFIFNELFPGGFTPRFGGDLEDKSIVVGLRGELAIGNGLRYDMSYTYGRNDVDFFINNTINASLGPNTPTSFMPGGYTQKDSNFNLDLSYGIPNDMFASDINLAMGFEHRNEEFTIRAGDANSFALGSLATPLLPVFPAGQGFASSSNGFGGFTPASAGTTSQKNYAVYGEVEADITDQFILQGAVRYEDFYTSFGGTVNYKIGALYAVNDNLTFRSTYSTGFHAPTGGQANVTNVTTQFSGGQLQDQGTLPLSSPAGQFIADRLELDTGVRPTLGPEESKNFTAGVAFGLGAIDFTVDYFRITVDNRISISDQQDFLDELLEVATENSVVIPMGSGTSQVLNLLDTAGVLNASDFAGSEDLTSFGFFQNAFDTRTQGIDIVASTNFEPYAGSNTNVSMVFNWTDTSVTDLGLTSAAPLSTGRAKQLEDSTPATRGNISFNHTDGPLRGLVRINYYGSFFECHLDDTNNDAPPAVPCGLAHFGGSQFPIDVELGYEVSDGIELIAGAQNVFDSFPDALAPGNAGVAGAQFPPVAPAGYNGGFFYFKLRVDL